MAYREDMTRVEASLDKSIIDGKHIRVTKERFPRARVDGVSYQRKLQSAVVHKPENLIVEKNKVSASGVQGVNIDASVKKSYRDALVNSTKPVVEADVDLVKSVMDIKVIHEDENITSVNILVANNEWMQCCLI
ncbi:hypothetical protein V6N13_098335 [Hibiscus sabdariffa]